MSSKQKEADLLAFGYANKYSEYHVPFVIKKIIYQFYDSRFYWNVSNGELKTLIESNTKYNNYCGFNCNQLTISKVMNVGNDIKFNMFINRSSFDALHYGFGIHSFPSNIHYIDVFISIQCETLNKMFCQSYKIKKCCGIKPIHTDRLGTCELLFYDNLIFNCSIKIGSIKYKLPTIQDRE